MNNMVMMMRTITNPTISALAIFLHKTQCNHNHTDACPWHYEIEKGVHDWSAWAHNEYYKKAETVYNEVSAENEVVVNATTFV